MTMTQNMLKKVNNFYSFNSISVYLLLAESTGKLNMTFVRMGLCEDCFKSSL